MSLGQKNPRELREMEIDMMARKEQAKNMAAQLQDRYYDESKTSKVLTVIILTLVAAFIVYIIFFAGM